MSVALSREVKLAIEHAVAETVRAHAGNITPLRLTISQAAKAVGVDRSAVYRAIQDGALQASRLGGTGDLGVRPADLERWAFQEPTPITKRVPR